MRKVRVFLVMMILGLALSAGGFAFQNEPEGFRGLKWGDPPTEDMISVKHVLKEFREEKEVDYYGKIDDKKKIGDAYFDLILYVFYLQPEPKFMMVNLYFSGEGNYNLLKTILRGRFGEETEKKFNKLAWIGSKAFIMLIMYDSIKELGKLSLGSTLILMEKIKAEEQKVIEKSKDDF